jgi:colanic acid/amylovoran biosynthesis protein
MINNKKEYNVCLLGASLTTPNMGVSALAASLIKLIKTIKPEANISFLIGNRSSAPQQACVNGITVNVNVVNYRLTPKSPIQKHLFWIFFLAVMHYLLPIQFLRELIVNSNPWLKTISKSHFIGEIRGGDSFSDIYGFKRFIIGAMPSIIVLLLKKELILLPQTYGPFNLSITKKVAKFIFKHSKYIYSRDNFSHANVYDVLHNNSKVIGFCPDVAFTLEPMKPEHLSIIPSFDSNLSQPLIGLNINGLMYNGGYSRSNMFSLKLNYKDFIAEFIDSVIKNTEANILLIPHTFAKKGDVNSDPDACLKVYEIYSKKYPNRIFLVDRKYDQHQIKFIIGMCDFVIASRMHACIAALSQGIPAIGLAYSKKFIGVFDSVGFGEMVIDATQVNNQDTLSKILSIYKQRKTKFSGIIDSIDKTKKQIQNTFVQLLDAS